MDAARPTKGHQVPRAGPKAEKKEKASKRKRGLPENPDRHNWKAFNPANIGRTKRSVQRNVDREHQKQYVPRVDRTERAAPPPPLVAVVGPRGVGKSTLIRSLVKLHARQRLHEVRGPITLVTGKDRRLTLLECPSDDVCAMVDVAKVRRRPRARACSCSRETLSRTNEAQLAPVSPDATPSPLLACRSPTSCCCSSTRASALRWRPSSSSRCSSATASPR